MICLTPTLENFGPTIAPNYVTMYLKELVSLENG